MARKKQEPGKFVKTREPGVYKRDGVYIARVYDSQTGTRENLTAITFDQAVTLRRDAQRAQRMRKSLGVQSMTVAEWAARWLELFPRRKESTNLHNTERVSRYLKDFGDRPLPGVDHLEANEWAARNPTRVRVVKAFLNDAVKARLISENPFDGIDKGATQGRQGITVLTDEELAKLVATAARVHGEFGEQVLGPMIEVAAGTGLRPGELYALDRASVDLEEGEVHVWRQLNGRTRRMTTVKGTRYERRVVMHDRARRALARYEFPEALPEAERNTIWRTVRGVPFKQREQAHYWPSVRAAFVAGLPESHHLQRRMRGEIPGGMLDLYELRHKFGTWLAREGCSMLEIMDQMGHEDSKVTRVYLHMTNSDVRANVKARVRRAA